MRGGDRDTHMGNAMRGECGCGERVRVGQTGEVFKGTEPEPTRTCLPQVDPLPSNRLTAVRAQGIFYECRVMLKHTRKELQTVLPSGMPIELPETTAEWDEYTEYFDELLNCEGQVLETIREHLGTEANSYLFGRKSKDRFSSFEEAATLFYSSPTSKKGFPKPFLCTRWMDDVEFSRHRLVGSPGSLRQVSRMDHLPFSLKIADDIVIGRIGPYNTLQEAMQAGKIFVTDYSSLKSCVKFGFRDPIPPKEPPPEDPYSDEEDEMQESPSGDVMCNPIALFYVEPNGQVLPLCIRLYNDVESDVPGQVINNPIYTPDDNIWAWTMAKMYFNSAELHYHLLGLVGTQTVYVSALIQCMVNKSMSVHHPVRQLLAPHLRACLAFAKRFEQTLLKSPLLHQVLSVSQSSLRKIMTLAYKNFDFANAAFKHDWRERMNLESDLPGDHYREDGMRWWDAIENYVKSVVSRYYTKVDDIESDSELKDLFRDMSTRLTRVKDIHPSRPWDAIIFNLTAVVFMSSVQFSARTKGIYNSYACPFFFPGKIKGTPLTERSKDSITESDVLELLPTKKESLLQIGLAYVLSGRSTASDSAMPFTGVAGYVDRKTNTFADELNTQISKISTDVEERNSSLEVPFENLHPSNVKSCFGLV